METWKCIEWENVDWSKLDERQTELYSRWYEKKEKSQRSGIVKYILFVLPVAIMAGCTLAVGTAEEEPYERPNFGPSCVETVETTCTWAEQEVSRR